MLCNIAIDYEYFEGLLELSIAKFEKSSCILVISDFLNGRPFQIKLRKLDCFLLWRSDAKLVYFDEAPD